MVFILLSLRTHQFYSRNPSVLAVEARLALECCTLCLNGMSKLQCQHCIRIPCTRKWGLELFVACKFAGIYLHMEMKRLRDPGFYRLRSSDLYSRARFPMPPLAIQKPWLEHGTLIRLPLGNTKPLALQSPWQYKALGCKVHPGRIKPAIGRLTPISTYSLKSWLLDYSRPCHK